MLLLVTAAEAASSGNLMLRGYVPARSTVVIDSVRGTFRLQTNTGKFALATQVQTTTDSRGFQIVTVTPQ